jgi:hypothetical protein
VLRHLQPLVTLVAGDSTDPHEGKETMLRRTIGLFITLGVAFWAGYQLAWNQDVLDDLGGVGFFAVLAIALVAAVLLFMWPGRFSVFLALVLGGLAVHFGGDVIENITWSGVGMVAVALIVIGILWVLTCSDKGWASRKYRKVLNSLPKPSKNGNDDTDAVLVT